ncbi:MAG: sodium:calcium antiporter [Ardenticatenaceae bacterium]|nr:sodium:calcium antiporter [Ardenticatenaceae bacterium]MCB8973750.1 sodium:calcium antiporter [Ardenticatenaceae bacterium]
MFLNVLIIIVSIVGLAYGATFIVDSAARMARHFGVSELIIGLTIVAVGTSAPEFAVTISAAVSGQADISVSNIVGSNIFNLGFILGGVVAVRAITTTPKIVYRDGGMLAGATLILLFFMRDLQLQQWEGGVLLALLFAYLLYLYTQRDVDLEEVPDGEFRWIDVPLFALGIGMVLIGGYYLVDSATEVARMLGLSEWVIGVTIVAAGTSAPEMATSLVGVLRGHSDISIGNLIGSDLFNLLGVLGLAGLVQTSPMVIDSAGLSSLMLLSGMVIFVVILMRVGWKLNRWEGVMLILINLLRWIFDFASK